MFGAFQGGYMSSIAGSLLKESQTVIEKQVALGHDYFPFTCR